MTTTRAMGPEPTVLLVVRRAPAPAAGGAHRDDVAFAQLARRLGRQRPVVEAVLARAPGPAALQAGRLVAAAVGQQRQGRGLEDADHALDAVAAVVAPAAAGAVGGRVGLHAAPTL